jgi:hypothetical protein
MWRRCNPGVIDAASSCCCCCWYWLRVCCPEGCLPACDACCCLDVRTAKVPREVLKHGRVVVRFMEWNQEANIVEPAMYR